MKINIYFCSKFIENIEVNNNGNILDIINLLSKYGGKYYLFTTNNLTYIDLINKNDEIYNYTLKEVRKNKESPYIVTQKIFIYNDDTILNINKDKIYSFVNN